MTDNPINLGNYMTADIERAQGVVVGLDALRQPQLGEMVPSPRPMSTWCDLCGDAASTAER